MPAISELEQKIKETLLRQLNTYSAAMPLAECLAEDFDASDEQQAQLARLDSLMRDAFLENEKLTALMTEVEDKQQLAIEIRTTSRSLASEIEKMMELFDKIEQKAHAVKQRMSPELNETLQAKKMQNAYSKHQS